MTEDEMAGWHHLLDGHGFGWTPAVGDGQGGLACCDSWGLLESDTTEWHQFHFPHLLLFSVYKRNWHSDPDKTIRGGTSLPSSRTPSFPIKLYSLLQQKKKKRHSIQFSHTVVSDSL